MRKGVRIIILMILLTVVLLGIFISINKGISVKTMEVESGYISKYFTEEGVVGNSNVFEVYTYSGGKVLSVSKKIGDEVKKGDVICTLSNEQIDLDINTLEQQIIGYNAQIATIKSQESERKTSLENTISELNYQLDTINVQKEYVELSRDDQIKMQQLLIEQTQRELAVLKEQLDKYEQLYNNGLVSKYEYDEMYNQVESYENLLEQNKKQLDMLQVEGATGSKEYYQSLENGVQAQISNLESQLSTDYSSSSIDYYNSLINTSDAQIELLNQQKGDLAVKASMDGVLETLPVENKNYISPQTIVATISKDSTSVETYISQTDYDNVKEGSPVNIIIDKRSGEVIKTGKVSFVDNVATLITNQLGEQESVVKVLITPDEKLELISGYNVEVEFLIYENENGICVPKESVFPYNDGYAVFTVVDGKAKITEIKKGQELRENVEIIDGLKDGDIVIIDANNDKLESGTKIKDLTG